MTTKLSRLLSRCRKQTLPHPERAAVIVVDMQDGFIPGRFVNAPGLLKKIIENQIVILDWAASEKVPTFVCEYRGYGKTIQPLVSRLPRTGRAIIEKSYNSAFRGTDLDDRLGCYGCTDLIVFGVNSFYCVRATAIGALLLNYRVVLPNGCHANARRCSGAVFPRADKFVHCDPKTSDYLNDENLHFAPDAKSAIAWMSSRQKPQSSAPTF